MAVMKEKLQARPWTPRKPKAQAAEDYSEKWFLTLPLGFREASKFSGERDEANKKN